MLRRIQNKYTSQQRKRV